MEERNDAGWQAPPPPEMPHAVDEPPQMTEVETLGNIFLEPGRTFEDLKRKPRFWLALLIIVVLSTAYSLLFLNKIGEDALRRNAETQIENSPQGANMSPEQKQNAVNLNMKITGIVRYLIPVFILIGFLIGALIYFVATKAFGGEMSFSQAISVWVYSSFPPIVVAMIANLIVLFLKSADDIDFAASQRGLIHANPTMFFDGKTMPVIATVLATLDIFQIWGWILAAIGLHKIAKLSKGSAWTIVLIVAGISLAYRILSAVMSGNPM